LGTAQTVPFDLDTIYRIYPDLRLVEEDDSATRTFDPKIDAETFEFTFRFNKTNRIEHMKISRQNGAFEYGVRESSQDFGEAINVSGTCVDSNGQASF
jgi:hypothetical protein